MIMYGQNTLSALEGMHSVGKGETWENIAASKGVSIAELQTANPDINPDKKLKKGKTYYYKIRAYKTVNKNKGYSAYSAVKSVKIKK
jgi:LysM repeat protein